MSRLTLVMCACLASTALAAKPTVALSGPAPLTKWVGKELSKRYTTKVVGAVSAMPTAKEVRDVTGGPGAIALVICQASGKFVTLQVLSGHDGTPLDTVTVKAAMKKLPKTMPKPQLAALMFAVASGKAPGKEPAPAPEPVAVVEKPAPVPVKETPAEPPPKVESKKELAAKKKEEPRPAPVKEAPPAVVATPAEAKPSPHPAVRAWVGFGGFNRSFSWAGNPSPSLATASQPFSGDISVGADWYPAAHFTSSFLANLGVFATGDFGVGMVSRVQESRFAHSATRLRFGGLVRLPLGERFSLVGHVGYSRHELTTSAVAVNDGSARPNIPDVLFNGFRTGLGLRLRLFGTVEIDALGGFQLVAGKGELGSPRFFPQATAFAVDAGGGISVELAEHLRLRAGVEWQRYFITLNAAENSTFTARSAGDQYITAAASLQWVM
mgnify:CR=1 FL=1